MRDPVLRTALVRPVIEVPAPPPAQTAHRRRSKSRRIPYRSGMEMRYGGAARHPPLRTALACPPPRRTPLAPPDPAAPAAACRRGPGMAVVAASGPDSRGSDPVPVVAHGSGLIIQA